MRTIFWGTVALLLLSISLMGPIRPMLPSRGSLSTRNDSKYHHLTVFSSKQAREERSGYVEILLDGSRFRICGGERRYIVYSGGGILKLPLRPPTPYIVHHVNISDGWRVKSVHVVYRRLEKVPLGNISVVPPPLVFSLINYSAELERASGIEPPNGTFPEDILIGWRQQGRSLKLIIAATVYDVGSGLAYLVRRVRLRVFYEPIKGETSTSPGANDTVLIVPAKYLDVAEEYVRIHQDHRIWVVTTDWIYKNYEEAEPPPFPGFQMDGLPLRERLAEKYNYSLALRIVEFLRGLIGTGVRHVVLLGSPIEVPPSYYYWDAEFYFRYRVAKQAWIPTDFFYASPDYDMFPEFSVGRIPPLSVGDAQTYMEKVSAWLSEYHAGGEWLRRAYMVGGMPFGTLYFSGETTLLSILNSGLLGNVSVVKYFETNSNYTKDNVRSLYKGGAFLLLQFSHGTETALYKLSKLAYRWVRLIDNNYLFSLDNASELPIVVAPACSSGAYDRGVFGKKLGYSFGQAVIFSKAGGIAYVGMSRIAFGALTFYLDNGVLRAPFLLFAQEMLRCFFEAYRSGSELLGEAYVGALRIFAERNPTEYWVNMRTLLEFVLIGDPLIPLPSPGSCGCPPAVEPVDGYDIVRVPLTYGYALRCGARILRLNISDDGLIRYRLISPMLTESFSEPLIEVGFSGPRIVGILPPFGGVHILEVEDDESMEVRVYIRGPGARIENVSLEYVDTNNNGKYELARLSMRIRFGYFSKSSLQWGFRAWIRVWFAGEGRLRVNWNRNIAARDIGSRKVVFVMDCGMLAGGTGALNIYVLFFSWWPWLYTWWFSGPSIWIEFGVRIVTRIDQEAFEPAVDVALAHVSVVNLDSDPEVEAAELFFRLRSNLRVSGSLELYIYLRRYVIGSNGGIAYFLSTMVPYVLPACCEETTIRYVWGLKSWYAKGTWGSPPAETNATIRHCYSVAVRLRCRGAVTTILTTPSTRIRSLDNQTADDSESKKIIIEDIRVEKIYSSAKLSGVAVSMTGYSEYPHFQRTEFVLEKYVNGSWTQIYRRDINMGIFIFFWPAKSTTFKICIIPAEFLGNGSFRVSVRAYKYAAGRKIVLANRSVTFVISESICPAVRLINMSLVDYDDDGRYGHARIHVGLGRAFDIVEVRYSLYWSDGSSRHRFSGGRIVSSLADSIDRVVSISGEKLTGLGNISIEAKVSVSFRDREFLLSIPIRESLTLAENVSGSMFEASIRDFSKKILPTIAIDDAPYVEEDNISFSIHISTEYSKSCVAKISIDGEEVSSKTVIGCSTISISTMLSEGSHNVFILLSSDAYELNATLFFVVDMSPPEVNISAPKFSKSISVSWRTHDISGVRRIEILLNGTPKYYSDSPEGSATIDSDEGTWIVVVQATDLAGLVGEATAIVVVDRTPPSITIIGVDNETVEMPPGPLNICWSASDNVGISMFRIVVDYVHIHYTNSCWFVIEFESGEHMVEVDAIDYAGNMASSFLRVIVDHGANQMPQKIYGGVGRMGDAYVDALLCAMSLLLVPIFVVGRRRDIL